MLFPRLMFVNIILLTIINLIDNTLISNKLKFKTFPHHRSQGKAFALSRREPDSYREGTRQRRLIVFIMIGNLFADGCK